MYESPISIFERITHEIANEKDKQIIKAIDKIGVDVNKEELIMARIKDYGVCELDFSMYETYRCSNCKGEVDDDVNYCPHCGAKFDEEEDE